MWTFCDVWHKESFSKDVENIDENDNNNNNNNNKSSKNKEANRTDKRENDIQLPKGLYSLLSLQLHSDSCFKQATT
jgi:hypothetical protein